MTRICVLADVHGNLPALEAVLAHTGECDDWWCLGDIVGYGPNPNECGRSIRELGAIAVVGNHDLGSLGKIDLSDFNHYARSACEWTGNNLTRETIEYLESLPLTARPTKDVLLVHGSPREPIWEYVLSGYEALDNFEVYGEKLCFNGHSHAPVVFSHGPGGEVDTIFPGDGSELRFEAGRRYMVNVGSVGQPRDGDPRAGYVIYRPGERVIEYHRVEYPVSEVQKSMLEAGLPMFLIQRLAAGR